MRQPIILGSGTHYHFFNTEGADGAPITLVSGALRVRVNGGAYVNAGVTLSTDHTDGSSGVTGQHRIALDIDNATLALTDGDEVDVVLSTGTVDSVSKAGRKIWSAVAVADGLTQAQKDDVRDNALIKAQSAAWGGITFEALVRKVAAVVFGRTSGGGTTEETFQSPDGADDEVAVTNDGTDRTAVDVSP